MIEALEGLWAFAGQHVELVAAVVGAIFAYWLYRKRMRDAALSICIVYRETVTATLRSLEDARREARASDAGFSRAPSDAIYDFRREDWLAVHHALCGDLGRLMFIDRIAGKRATRLVSSFFEDLRYTRELFARLIATQKALAALRETQWDDEPAAGDAAHAAPAVAPTPSAEDARAISELETSAEAQIVQIQTRSDANIKAGRDALAALDSLLASSGLNMTRREVGGAQRMQDRPIRTFEPTR